MSKLKHLQTLAGHTDRAWNLAWSPNGMQLRAGVLNVSQSFNMFAVVSWQMFMRALEQSVQPVDSLVVPYLVYRLDTKFSPL